MKLTDQYFFFIHLAALDESLSGKHVQVYLTLLSLWKLEGFANPFGLDKKELALLCKFTRRASLNNVLKVLHTKRFIVYKAPNSRYHQTEIEICSLANHINAFYPDLLKEPSAVHVFNSANIVPNHVGNSVSMEPHVYNSANINAVHVYISANMKRYVFNSANMKSTPNSDENQVLPSEYQPNTPINEQEITSLNNQDSAKKATYIYSISNNINKNSIASNACARETATKKRTDQNTTQHQSKKSRKPKFKPPTQEEVAAFLAEYAKQQLQKTNANKWNLSSSIFQHQASKFVNHYESVGWVIGKNKPMRNWQASARNWMLNYHQFNPEPKPEKQSNYLDVNQNKDYDIPL